MNSDVNVFIMAILPMLKSGVVIGIHDLEISCDYPNEFKNWYWNEQHILRVYLFSSCQSS
jgi:hypothetical protein